MGNGNWGERVPDDSEDWIREVAAENENDIQTLLDLGYEQLDGFVQWLEERLEVSTRIAQQDCFNAEALIDYLANHQHKSVEDLNEYELRWFLFSYYIRKAMAEEETALRLPESLRRFFEYLSQEYSQPIPIWAPAALDDGYYSRRRRAYHELEQVDEEAWEEGFRDWCADLEEDLDARCLWLPREMGSGMTWGCAMGWREAALYAEANRNWQAERDHLLQEGLDYDTIRDHLNAEYLAWLDLPQDRLEGQTPREVIAAERMEREELD